MVLSINENQSGGSTTSTNIEIEALDEQHEQENLEYLRQNAGVSNAQQGTGFVAGAGLNVGSGVVPGNQSKYQSLSLRFEI